MEKQITEIPVLQKSKQSGTTIKATTSCCSQPADQNVSCCTPSKTAEENNGACCAQPADGSSCCDK